MTPTEQAARWLADVPRYVDFEPGAANMNWLREADALAAIARHLAPGDDLVETAAKRAEYLANYAVDSGDESCAEDADTITALLVRISALTATVVEVNQRADNHWETLRSIRDIAKSSGDLARIVQWVDDAEAGYNETAETTLAAEMDRRTAAEAEVSRLRDRLARMEGALDDEADAFNRADWFWRTMDPDDCGDSPEEAINRAMVGRFCVCEIASSYAGPTRYGFIAPVLDPESDDEEFVHFATQQEAIDAAKARAALPAPPAEDVRAGAGFDQLVLDAIGEAERAMQRFPQPNYVISKIAEEAGEVVKAAIHCAEWRETPENLRGEMKQLIAMLYRLWVEGDEVHGLPAVSEALIPEAKP